MFAQNQTPENEDFVLLGLGMRKLDFLDSIEFSRLRNSSSNQTFHPVSTEAKNKMLQVARHYFDSLLTTYPNSQLAQMALNYKGNIEVRLGRIPDAKATFRQMSQKCQSRSDEERSRSSCINKALCKLAEISILEKDYAKALQLLDSMEIYPRVYMCSYDIKEDEIRIQRLYGQCYVGVGKLKKGLDILIPQILDNSRGSDST